MSAAAEPIIQVDQLVKKFGELTAVDRVSFSVAPAPGVIGMAILFTSVFSGIGLLWDRQFGFLEETLVAPVPRIQIMAGRTLGGATVAMIQGLLVAFSRIRV